MNYSNIIVYATKTCPYCTMAADWLTAKKVVFEKILVDENQQAAADMVKKTGQMGVPVIEVQYTDRNPEFLVGFNPPQLAYMLGVQS
jgi:glutaredoxin 3